MSIFVAAEHDALDKSCLCSRPGYSFSHRNPDSSLPSVADEFQQLSVQERENVLEELHGVAEDVVETPELVDAALCEMRQELSNVPQRRRRAYDRAIFLCPALQYDDKLHLMFLRGERYDGKMAASQLCLHFENKRQLFPDEKLPCRISLDDLSEDDMDCLRQGNYHPLPTKDQSGRTVIVLRVGQTAFKHWTNLARYMYYQHFALMEDEETQIKGVVTLIYIIGVNSFETKMIEAGRHLGPFADAFCMRHCASHICFDNPLLHRAISFFHHVAPKQHKPRKRYHFGSHLECSYSLRSFGIHLHELASPAITERYISDRRQKEEEERKRTKMKAEERKRTKMNETEFISNPGTLDVLMGRGKPYHKFPGNVRLAEVVDRHTEEYDESPERFDKTLLSMTILRSLQDQGTRFLERVDGKGWRIVSQEAARSKVTQALRGKANSKKLRIVRDDDDNQAKRRRV